MATDDFHLFFVISVTMFYVTTSMTVHFTGVGDTSKCPPQCCLNGMPPNTTDKCATPTYYNYTVNGTTTVCPACPKVTHQSCKQPPTCPVAPTSCGPPPPGETQIGLYCVDDYGTFCILCGWWHKDSCPTGLYMLGSCKGIQHHL